jgi:PBP1b-binding outer membrane lipoprotein LpoB
LYLRSDAVVPIGFCLVPITITDKVKIAEYITRSKGGNPDLIITKSEIVDVAPKTSDNSHIDWESIAKNLIVVNKAQADLISSLSSFVDVLSGEGGVSASVS